MGFKKGKQKTGGRKEGTPNKTTKELRKLYQDFFETNFPKLQIWFDEVSKENPVQAISLFLRISKFVIPDLQRIDVENSQDIIINWNENLEPLTWFTDKKEKQTSD